MYLSDVDGKEGSREWRKGPQEALMAGKRRKGSWSDVEGWKGSRECFDGMGGLSRAMLMAGKGPGLAIVEGLRELMLEVQNYSQV